MNNRKVGALAGIISVLSLVLQTVPEWVLSRWISDGFQRPLPIMFGTIGQTVTVYRTLIETGGPLVTVLLGMGLGYYVGTRMDVRANYRRFLGAVGAGSTIGVVVAWAIIIGSMSSFPSTVGSVDLLLVLSFVRMVITVGLVATVGAFAGAALADFQRDDRSPVRPMNSRTQPPPQEQETTPPDDLESHS